MPSMADLVRESPSAVTGRPSDSPRCGARLPIRPPQPGSSTLPARCRALLRSHRHRTATTPSAARRSTSYPASASTTRIVPLEPSSCFEVIQRLVQVPRGMQDVGGDDQIERMRLRSLLDRITLDIERPVLHERIAGELVLSVRGEPWRDVGEHVFGAVLRQHRKNEAGRPAGASAYLQDPQRPFLGERRAISATAFCASRLLRRKSESDRGFPPRRAIPPGRSGSAGPPRSQHGRKVFSRRAAVLQLGLTFRSRSCAVPEVRLLGRGNRPRSTPQHQLEPSAVVRGNAQAIRSASSGCFPGAIGVQPNCRRARAVGDRHRPRPGLELVLKSSAIEPAPQGLAFPLQGAARCLGRRQLTGGPARRGPSPRDWASTGIRRECCSVHVRGVRPAER